MTSTRPQHPLGVEAGCAVGAAVAGEDPHGNMAVSMVAASSQATTAGSAVLTGVAGVSNRTRRMHIYCLAKKGLLLELSLKSAHSLIHSVCHHIPACLNHSTVIYCVVEQGLLIHLSLKIVSFLKSFLKHFDRLVFDMSLTLHWALDFGSAASRTPAGAVAFCTHALQPADCAASPPPSLSLLHAGAVVTRDDDLIKEVRQNSVAQRTE